MENFSLFNSPNNSCGSIKDRQQKILCGCSQKLLHRLNSLKMEIEDLKRFLGFRKGAAFSPQK